MLAPETKLNKITTRKNITNSCLQGLSKVVPELAEIDSKNMFILLTEIVSISIGAPVFKCMNCFKSL